MAKPEIDPISGTATTGHEWDGIRELNSPLPTWWVYVFYATIAWAVGYWVFYPSWPTLTTYARGTLGYSARGELAGELAAAEKAKITWLARFKDASVAAIAADPELRDFAMAGGAASFRDNCAPCHQMGGAGAPGYPALVDDKWLWGGTLDDIRTTITHGIRWPGDADTRMAEMPRFGQDGILTPPQIGAVADYVLTLSGGKAGAAHEEGKTVFAENCAACHGEGGGGIAGTGAPTLDNQLWLYGGGRDAVVAQVTSPRHGVMPAWGGRLDEATIKQLTIYVHALGGGL